MHAHVAAPLLRLSVTHIASLGTPLLSAIIAETESQDEPMKSHHAATLIAGTSIGGGFLALPTVTAPIGFPVAATAMCGVWCMLMVAAFAYAEGASRVLLEKGKHNHEDATTPGGLGGALGKSADGGAGGAAGDGQQKVSIASLSAAAFGARASTVCTVAFVGQVLAMITAQLVKTAEVATAVSGGAIPYTLGCILPAVIFGAFTLKASPRAVERANTALTISIVVGFILLCRNVAASGASSVARLTVANWQPLLQPVRAASTGAGSGWPLPVFLSVLQFGAAIPVVVQGMQAHRSAQNNQRMRRALLAGASLPLILGLLWTAVATAQPPMGGVGAGGVDDPVLRLLLGARAVALPAQALCAGAIGSTLIGAYLTLNQLFGDVLAPRQAALATLAVVIGPALLGTAGPSLYLPLLGLSGAFPCTILYVLVPLLALRVLRRNGVGAHEGEWMPEGTAGLLAFSSLPLSMLATSGATLGATLGRRLARNTAITTWLVTATKATSVRAALGKLIAILRATLLP